MIQRDADVFRLGRVIAFTRKHEFARAEMMFMRCLEGIGRPGWQLPKLVVAARLGEIGLARDVLSVIDVVMQPATDTRPCTWSHTGPVGGSHWSDMTAMSFKHFQQLPSTWAWAGMRASRVELLQNGKWSGGRVGDRFAALVKMAECMRLIASELTFS